VRVFRLPERPEQHRTYGAQILALLGFLALALLVGAVGGTATVPNVHSWYDVLPHPPGTPPDWVFGPVWTLLYIAMAVAAWLIWRGPDILTRQRRALRLWGWQLAANALWSPVFFALHRPDISFFVILVLDGLIVMTIAVFRPVSRIAAALMVPYLAWCLYATYLNAGFWFLNR
jgi:tryptophan-rich sensory protein